MLCYHNSFSRRSVSGSKASVQFVQLNLFAERYSEALFVISAERCSKLKEESGGGETKTHSLQCCWILLPFVGVDFLQNWNIYLKYD